MTTLALPIPKLRRWRKPPGRVWYYLIELCLCAGWLLTVVVLVATDTNPIWAVVNGICGLLLTLAFVIEHWRFKQALRAWLDDRPVAPVTRRQWRWLAFRAAYLAFEWALILGGS